MLLPTSNLLLSATTMYSSTIYYYCYIISNYMIIFPSPIASTFLTWLAISPLYSVLRKLCKANQECNGSHHQLSIDCPDNFCVPTINLSWLNAKFEPICGTKFITSHVIVTIHTFSSREIS